MSPAGFIDAVFLVVRGYCDRCGLGVNLERGSPDIPFTAEYNQVNSHSTAGYSRMACSKTTTTPKTKQPIIKRVIRLA
jgi:hypothetical protein